LNAVDARHDSLPVFRSAFFGREPDVAELRALITDHRLVTLTGPGGAGKTRVAVEAAAGEQPSTRDGVSFADLSVLARSASVGDIWRSIAAATGAPSDGTVSPRSSVLGNLRDRQALVVLDNCEHVVDAAAEVIDDLTTNAPTVTVLSTSRETLAIDGEHVFRLPPLSSEGVDSPSVRLFVDRAVAADPTLLTDRSELDTVATLCERLEGSPLAIELAASRISVLRPAEILANIDDRLAILHARRGRGRQTSLRATVEWSYSLLEPDEQAALRRLAVLDGSFDAAAAEAVIGLARRSAAVDFLESAAAKSLVVVEPWSDDSAARFSLLDTIRAFGLELLAESGEESDARERAASHYHGTLLEEYTADPFVVASLRRRPRLMADWPGYLAALDWWHGDGASTPGAATRLAELATAISYPWKDAFDEARFFTYVGMATNEPSLAPSLKSFAHAMYAWTSAVIVQPDVVMRVMQAVQFANETPNDMSTMPQVVAAMIASSIGMDDVALEAADSGLRSANESRYAVLVPIAHGARGMALSGARRYEAAVEELDAAAHLPEGFPDDYDFLVRYASTAVVCHHLLEHHDDALAAMNRLVERHAHVPPPMEQLMITMARVVAMCPFDPAAAGEVLRRYLEQIHGMRQETLDRHALVLLAIVDFYRGDERSAAESLAMCNGPYEVLTPLIWEYRQRIEGWPTEELDQHRSVSMAAHLADPLTQDARVSERLDELVTRWR
jgi:predicted ATPase